MINRSDSCKIRFSLTPLLGIVRLASRLSLPVNIIKKAVDCKIQVLAILLRKSYSKLNIPTEAITSVGCYCVDALWAYVGSHKSAAR